MNINQIDYGIGYKNIVLIPKRGIVSTRDEVDVSCDFLGKKYKLPICPANMKCVIDFKLAEFLSLNGYFYILHRFYDYDEIFNWIEKNQNLPLISISVGVKERDKEFISKILGAKLRVDIITIDISHGFCDLMKGMIQGIKSLTNCKVIAGNVWGDNDSVVSLEHWGADAIKVGLSYGQSCITYNKTRIASPMFSCGLEARKWTDLPLIGDGGIRDNGDITLGLRAGYDMIMAGSIFAACDDSPAEFVRDCPGGNYFKWNNSHNRLKSYYGSASAENKGHNKNIEGKNIEIECNGLSIEEKLEEIRQDLTSSCSFLGGDRLNCLKHAEYQIVL